MITLNKLRIYTRYLADGDMFVRSGTKKEKELMEPDNWSMIDRLIQRSIIVKNGLGSKEFVAEVNDQLKKECENEEVIEKLRDLVSQFLRK